MHTGPKKIHVFRSGLNTGYALTLTSFLNHFHERYLIQATVSNYHVDDDHIHDRAESKIILKTHAQSVVQLLSVDQNNGNNPRIACAMVIGSLAISILRLPLLHTIDMDNAPIQDYIYHVIIPMERMYFVGPMRNTGSTNSVLYGTDALGRFLERIVDSTQYSASVATTNLFEAWIYKELREHEPNNSSVSEDSSNEDDESYNGMSIQDIADDNIQLLLQDDNQILDENDFGGASNDGPGTTNDEDMPTDRQQPINTMDQTTIPTSNELESNISRLANLNRRIIQTTPTVQQNNENAEYGNQTWNRNARRNQRARQNNSRSNNQGEIPLPPRRSTRTRTQNSTHQQVNRGSTAQGRSKKRKTNARAQSTNNEGNDSLHAVSYPVETQPSPSSIQQQDSPANNSFYLAQSEIEEEADVPSRSN